MPRKKTVKSDVELPIEQEVESPELPEVISVEEKSKVTSDKEQSKAEWELFFDFLRYADGCYVYDSHISTKSHDGTTLYSFSNVIRREKLREELATAYNILLTEEIISEKLAKVAHSYQ